MPVTVKYFASLRELLGRSEDVLYIEDEITVSDLWKQVSGSRSNPCP
jgi:Molybdopterin converting factor, small subunit